MSSDFLLGGGLAFLLALLGWGDQIGQIQERSRNQEKDFLGAYKIRWQDLRAIVRPSEDVPKKVRLLAVLRLLKQGALENEDDISLLKHFEQADSHRLRLEKIVRWRYWVICATSIAMLICGSLALHLQGDLCARCVVTWNHVYSTTTSLLVSAVIALTMFSALGEARFRRSLNDIEDMLRLAEQRRQKGAK